VAERREDGEASGIAGTSHAKGQGGGEGGASHPEGGGEGGMNLASTAPHIAQAADAAALAGRGPLAHAIEGRPESSGLVRGKRDDGAEPVLEVGLWSCTPGAFRLALAGDELLYILAGRATYTEHNGETVEAAPGHVIHFPSGWSGRCDVRQSLRA